MLQFVAYRLLQSLDAASSSNKTVLSSFAVPDCTFVLIVAATIGSIGSIIWFSYSQITSSVLAGLFGILAVGAFSALLPSNRKQSVLSSACNAARRRRLSVLQRSL